MTRSDRYTAAWQTDGNNSLRRRRFHIFLANVDHFDSIVLCEGYAQPRAWSSLHRRVQTRKGSRDRCLYRLYRFSYMVRCWFLMMEQRLPAGVPTFCEFGHISCTRYCASCLSCAPYRYIVMIHPFNSQPCLFARPVVKSGSRTSGCEMNDGTHRTQFDYPRSLEPSISIILHFRPSGCDCKFGCSARM